MNLEKNVNFPNLRHRLPGLSFLTQPQVSANRVRPMLGLALLLGLSSCAVLDREPSPGAQAGSSQRQAPAPSSASTPSPATPVLEAASAAEQQALIDAINRDGQASNYDGFREDVPAPEVTEGEDVVELNYEQAELRLVLEELADALDLTLVIDPSIDSQISIRTSPNRPLQRDDIWPLIRLLSRDAGVILEQAGDVFNARRVVSNLTADRKSVV